MFWFARRRAQTPRGTRLQNGWNRPAIRLFGHTLPTIDRTEWWSFPGPPAVFVTTKPAEADQNRIVACRVGSLTIAGVYFALNHQKASLFDYLLAKPAELGDDYLIIGDFNTGRHRVDEVGATFFCEDRFAALPAAGFHDLWRQSNGEEAREFSWASHRGGNFRLDHAFGSPKAAARLIDCSYDHSTRPGLTDHSALVVNLSD